MPSEASQGVATPLADRMVAVDGLVCTVSATVFSRLLAG